MVCMKRCLPHAWKDRNSQIETFPLCQETERASTEGRASLKTGGKPGCCSSLRAISRAGCLVSQTARGQRQQLAD